jgi:hypothetical protein
MEVTLTLNGSALTMRQTSGAHMPTFKQLLNGGDICYRSTAFGCDGLSPGERISLLIPGKRFLENINEWKCLWSQEFHAVHLQP